MKSKVLFFGALLCTITLGQSFAAERIRDVRDLDTNRNGIYEPCEVNACGEYQTGPCTVYCPVTKFKPKYYCEKRCVQEPYVVKKKCCRYVPEYYTKKYCRYVPEYYTKTFCKQVPEYYCVDETKYRTRTISEQKCRYEPYTCVEKRIIDCPPAAKPSCPPPVAECPSCPPADPCASGCPSNGRYGRPAGNGHMNGKHSSYRNGNGMNYQQMQDGNSNIRNANRNIKNGAGMQAQ